MQQRSENVVDLDHLQRVVSMSIYDSEPAAELRKGTWRRHLCARIGHEYHGALDPVTWRFEIVCLRCFAGATLSSAPAVEGVR